MILPPLYYGMHRFQTLLRKRQQTLCLRSFLNDAVTACDPKRKRNQKETNQKVTEKLGSTVRRKLQTPGEEKQKGWMSCLAKASAISCFSASGEHETHTGFKTHSCDVAFRKVFGSLFCKCGSHSAVDNTECCYLIFPVDASRGQRRRNRTWWQYRKL